MKYSLNSKQNSQKKWVRFEDGQRLKYHRQFNVRPLAFVACLLMVGFIGFQNSSLASADHRQPRLSSRHSSWDKKFTQYSDPFALINKNDRSSDVPNPQVPPVTMPPVTNPPNTPSSQVTNYQHAQIITTFFWVGEAASADNGYIPNSASAWDGLWLSHYGGVDSPLNRSGYLPGVFTPKENPFYFALPYSDFTNNGDRKTTANSCPNSSVASLAKYSWCKNGWIAIRHGNKVAYAQWEDVGPFEEDDTAYVFGTAAPKNKQDAKAGLDVSPAVKDYLGLADVDKNDWTFVSASQVPAGPWKQIVTTSKGDTVN